MTLPENIARKMKIFQAESPLPVHLKGGPADKMLFGVTVGLCGIGLVSIVHLLYTMGFKKKSG